LRVDFKASPSTLKIILKQERDGVVHDFVLFTLDLATLFVGWDLLHQDLFVLGAKHQGKVFHPIYCYPYSFQRSRWFSFFEDNGCEVTWIKRLEMLEGLAHMSESRPAARGCTAAQPPKKIPQDMLEQADLAGRLERLEMLERLAHRPSASSARARLSEEAGDEPAQREQTQCKSFYS
jgi:hypothetical protein